MFLAIVLLVVISAISVSYIVSVHNELYWKKRNILYHGGKNMVKDFWLFLAGDKPLFQIIDDVYNRHMDSPAVGTANMFKKALLVRDPTNVSHVLSENFKSFHHRGIEVNDHDKLADSVLFQNGTRWKLTRQKMTPLFTSAKLKNMHYIMDKSAQDFVKYIEENEVTNAFQAVSLFCCASISASVFGVSNDKSTFELPFLDVAKKATESSLKTDLKFGLNFLVPSVFRFLGLTFFGDLEKPFITAIKQILNERRKTNIKMHDFADLALDIQEHGTIKDFETGYAIEPTDELLAAQAFFFLIAGVDPSATAMFYTLFNLAKYPEIQKRVQDDIDTAFETHNGKIGYDVVCQMEYLDQVLDESLRMYPPVGFIGRLCTNDTVLPVGDIQVSKGTIVNIPIYSIHRDPKYYPNPEVFDPERFAKDKKGDRHSGTFMPFGNGNRICIGTRYARVQMKTGLIHILRNFNVKTNDANLEMEYAKMPTLLRPKNGHIHFERRLQN